MRFLSQCTSQESPLLLAARKSTNLALAEFRKFHGFEGSIDGPPVLLAKTSPPSQGLIATHLNHSAHRDWEIPVNRCALRQIGNGRLDQALTITMEIHRSGFKRYQADQRFEK